MGGSEAGSTLDARPLPYIENHLMIAMLLLQFQILKHIVSGARKALKQNLISTSRLLQRQISQITGECFPGLHVGVALQQKLQNLIHLQQSRRN